MLLRILETKAAVGCILILQLFCVSFVVAAIPAFPGAEGFGEESRGGRGDGSVKPRIIAVNTLDDVVARDGKISLREAVNFPGPRIIIFRVGGIIFLDKPLDIKEPYITIAGQAAPGPGITLAHHGISITKGCHDVIIRYLRVRNFFVEGDRGTTLDGILLYGKTKSDMINNVIIDHCSFSWAIDENVDFHGFVGKYTIQRCIIAEGSVFGHGKGQHSMGLLSGGNGSAGLTRGSIHHNIFVHNGGRNPRISGGHTFDFINNVVYDWYNNNAASFASPIKVNFIGNRYLAGADTSANLSSRHIISVPAPVNTNDIPHLYIKDNITPLRLNRLSDEWDIGVVWYSRSSKGAYIRNPADKKLYGLESSTLSSSITITSSEAVIRDVLGDAGSNFPFRDKLDRRLCDEIRYTTKKYPKQNINKNDINLGCRGANDGQISDVLTFYAKDNSDNKKYLPRQYKIKKNQTIQQAKEALFDLMIKRNTASYFDKARILNGEDQRYIWKVVKKTIPSESTVIDIMPDDEFPLLLDSDNDGLPDGWENEHGSSSNKLDTDNDGIEDGLEDDDGDGYLNIEEYINALPSMDFGNLPQL